MKTIKSYEEFGSSKIFKAKKVLDQTIFKRGCCQKISLFAKFSSGTQNFSISYEI